MMIKIIYIMLFILFLASCGKKEQKAISADTHVYPDQESWGATILITKDGKTIGHLKAGHVQKFLKRNITLLDQNIKIDFFNNKGQHTSVLTAKGGKVFDTRQDMLAYGQVVVVSDSGLTLYTDTLRWNNKEQKIYSDIPVKITSKDQDTLYGDSFKSDPDLTHYEIINPHGKSKKSLRMK